MSATKRSPCADCPWRKDAPVGFWHKSNFNKLWKNCQDDGLRLMLCHKSRKSRKKQICAGYAIVLGYESIGLRLAAISGQFDPNDYDANGIVLHPSFEAIMKAQGIRQPRRNRVKDNPGARKDRRTFYGKEGSIPAT